MEFRNLAHFTRWFLAQPISAWRPPMIPVGGYVLATDGGGQGASVYGVVLHRDPPYQVELFISAATEKGATFPEHRHPNVDSIECYLAGDIAFTIKGQQIAPEEAFKAADDGAHALTGTLQRVRRQDWHGAVLGQMGGCFLSLQRWTDGVEPTSVTKNWIGPAHVSST